MGIHNIDVLKDPTWDPGAIHWAAAIKAARECKGISREEWNSLYYDVKDSEFTKQKEIAIDTAKIILVRNKFIYPDTRIIE